MFDVIMWGYFSQECWGEGSVFLIVMDKAIILKDGCCSVDEIDSSLKKLRIFLKLLKWNWVMFGVFKHSNVKISVRKPVNSVSQIVDST